MQETAESLVIVGARCGIDGHLTSVTIPTSKAEFNKFAAILVLTRPSERCPCLYLYIHVSFRPFQAVNRSILTKNRRESLENPLNSQSMLGAIVDDVIGDPGSPTVPTNQRA